MAKKKIKQTKTKKQAQENKYFFGAILTIGGLVVIGIAFAMLFGGGGGGATVTGTSTGNAHLDAASKEMESQHGTAWRNLNIRDWLFNDSMNLVLHVDWVKWASKSYNEQVKISNQIGQQATEILTKHGQNRKQVYLMFHDEQDRMFGTYSPERGAEIQK